MQITIREPGSAITHFIGMIAAVFAAVPLLVKAGVTSGEKSFTAMAVFMASMVLLYGASAAYHSVNLKGRALRIFRKLDHMMIFVLIAGSYTPVCLIVLGGEMGYTLLALVWGIALAGMLIKAFWITCPKWFSSLIYFFRYLHFHGMGMRAGIRKAPGHSVHRRVPLASCRRHYLHRGRRHLRSEASAFQFQA